MNQVGKKSIVLRYTNNLSGHNRGIEVGLHWDMRLMNLALHVSNWSKDPRTGVGAVIANGKRDIDLGYNGFPAGISDLKDRLNDYDMKHKLIIHAEQNAMDNSTRSLVGKTLYVTYPPCINCTMSIISRKLGRVVTLQSSPEKMEKHHVNIELSKQLFLEAGIRFDIFN